MPIEVVPLRKRREDIPVLADYFLAQMSTDRAIGLSKGAVTLILGLRQTQRLPDGTHPAGPAR